MAYDIGPKIGIDGEDEFRKQLRTVNESIKTMGSEMKAVTSAFIGAEDSIEALTEKNKVLSKTIEAQEDKIQKQNNFLQRAKELYGDNAEETLKWQRAVNEATADLNKMKAQLKENENSLQAMENEIEDVTDDLKKAGRESSDFGDKLKNGLSAGAGVAVSALSALGTAAIAAGGAIVSGISQTAEYGDNIDKMSQKLGISAEAYQEWDHVLEHSGANIDSMQTSMKTLANAAADGSKSTQKAFEKLGLSMEEVSGMSQEDLFETVIYRLQDMGESTERTAVASDLLGRSATELGALLNMSSEDTEAMKQQLHELGGVMSNEAVKDAAAFQDSLQDLKTRGGAVVRDMLSELLPTVTDVMDGVGTAFLDMVNGVEGSEEVFAAEVEKLATAAGEKVPEFIELGGNLIVGVLNGILSNPDAIAETATDAVGQILDGFIENAPEMLVGGAELILKLAAGLAEELVEFLHDIPGFVTELKDEFIANADTFKEIGRELWDALFSGWKERARVNKLDVPTGLVQDVGIIPDGSHASGLDYVPFDGYVAELHRGEMVLPAPQADLMRSGGAATGSGAELATIAAAMVNGIQSVISNNAGAEIRLITPEGTELARYMLPGLIAVADAAGTPIIAK